MLLLLTIFSHESSQSSGYLMLVHNIRLKISCR